MDKMITVENEEEARFFPQRLILRIASIAAMFHNSRRMGEPPNSFFWTLTPDGDVHPEMLPVPPATGLVWLDGKTKPVLTTMMVAGHRLVRVYGFGVQRRIFSPKVIVRAVLVALETEDTNEEGETPGLPEGSAPPATPVASLGCRFDERETLIPCDNVADPLLDARVFEC